MELGDRYYASIPADDPRFAALREALAAARTSGRHSPAARMLGEWALLGFLLSTGRLTAGAAASTPPEHDPSRVQEAIRQIEAAVGIIGGFDDV